MVVMKIDSRPQEDQELCRYRYCLYRYRCSRGESTVREREESRVFPRGPCLDLVGERELGLWQVSEMAIQL